MRRTNPPAASKEEGDCHLATPAQRGFTLVEVLVAVLVLSVGLLGIALVQTRSLSNNNSSMARSMAVIASYSILEAMRSDRAAAIAGTYNTPTGGLKANACPTDTSTQAALQLANWCNELASPTLGGNLASTIGQISCTAVGSAPTQAADCTVTIQYDDSRIGAGGTTTQNVQTKTRL